MIASRISFGLNTVDRTDPCHLLPGHPVGSFPRGLWLGHDPAHNFLADGKFAFGLVGSLFGSNLLNGQGDVGGEGLRKSLILDLIVLFEKILVFPVENFSLGFIANEKLVLPLQLLALLIEVVDLLLQPLDLPLGQLQLSHPGYFPG